MIAFDEPQLLAALSAFLLPFFRILGIFTSAPILSTRSFPVRVRVGVSLLLAAIVAPMLPASPAADLGSPHGLLLVASEALIGIAIGFIARVILAAVEVAGEAIGLQMGLSFAGFFDPASGQMNAVTRILNWISLATFVAVNGPVMIVMAAIHSFTVIPPATAIEDWLTRMQPMALGAGMFELGVTIALPFMILLLFVNFGLGMISRIAPQLNVFAIGFPVTIGSGLLMLTLGLPLLQNPFDRMIEMIASSLMQ